MYADEGIIRDYLVLSVQLADNQIHYPKQYQVLCREGDFSFPVSKLYSFCESHSGAESVFKEG